MMWRRFFEIPPGVRLMGTSYGLIEVSGVVPR